MEVIIILFKIRKDRITAAHSRRDSVAPPLEPALAALHRREVLCLYVNILIGRTSGCLFDCYV